MSDPIDDTVKAAVDLLMGKLADEGRLVEGGWRAFEKTVLNPQAGPAQRHDMRLAYFAGAQHLYASMLRFMTEDDEPTEQDLRRMAALDAELKLWAANEVAPYREN